jgi:hypothetical protein
MAWGLLLAGVLVALLAACSSGDSSDSATPPTRSASDRPTAPVGDDSASANQTPTASPRAVALAAGDIGRVLPRLGDVPFGWTTVRSEHYLVPFHLAVTDERCQAALDAFDPLVVPAGATGSGFAKFSDLDIRIRALVVRVSTFVHDQTGVVRALSARSAHCRSMTGVRRHRAVDLTQGLGVPLGPGYTGLRIVDHDVPPIRMHWSSVLVAVGNARVTVSEIGYARLHDQEVADVAAAAVARAEATASGS